MIKSIHIGIIDPERQLCIDKQMEIYRDLYSLETTWPNDFLVSDYKDIREVKDLLFIKWMIDGFFVMDSDVVPLGDGWLPVLAGLWLPHSFGRLDYYMGAAVGEEAKKYLNDMLAYYSEKKPGFMWPVAYYNNHPSDLIKLIPSEKFNHLMLTTRRADHG